MFLLVFNSIFTTFICFHPTKEMTQVNDQTTKEQFELTHSYHFECAKRWLLNHEDCPSCRGTCNSKPSTTNFNDFSNNIFENITTDIKYMEDLRLKCSFFSPTDNLQDINHFIKFYFSREFYFFK